VSTTDPWFGDDVADQHRRIDRDAWDDVYIVGDVHGCLPTLSRLLAELDPGTDDLVVFVGDLVRRGPDSAGVVELVRSRPNFVSVRGNNEQKLLDGRRELDSLGEDDLSWLADRPLALSFDGHLVVHGGVDPRKRLAEHSPTELMNLESLAADGGRPYWWERYEGPRRVFFGHKVLERPHVGEHAVGLDTGCVYGGALTAYDLRRDRVVAVEPETTHRERRLEKFLAPTPTVER
jgi:serine/threonine protein phosphatase 1